MGKVHFRPFNTLVLKNVAVTDRNPALPDTTKTCPEATGKFRRIGCTPEDTLFKAEYITARFTLKSLTKNEGIEIGRAYIRNGTLNLVLEDSAYPTNLSRIFRLSPKEKETQDREIFLIRTVIIDGFRYTMRNCRDEAGPDYAGGIDWNDLDISGISLRAKDLRMKGKVMSGRLDRLSFSEKSGYSCDEISGTAAVGNGKALVSGLTIRDRWSELHLREFNMYYSGEEDFQDFVNKVRLEAEITGSTLDFRSLGYFAPQLQGNSLAIGISGSVEGPVEDLSFSGLEFSVPECSLSGTAAGKLSGVSRGKDMKPDIRIRRLDFTTAGLDRFIGYWSGGKAPGIGKFAEGTHFRFNGNLRGRLGRLRIISAVTSGNGNIGTDVTLSGIGTDRPLGIRGDIRTSDLNLKHIADNIPVNECSITASLDAELGKGGDAAVTIDSLLISRLNFNGYDYSNIAAAGRLAQNMFNGKVICSDPNLNFMFQGIFTLSPKTNNAIYRFYANVGYADLNALNIDRRGLSKASFRTVADFRQDGRGKDVYGKIEIADIGLENMMGKFDIGDIKVSSYSSDGDYGIRFSSRFADGEFSGNGPLTDFIGDLKSIVLRDEFPALYPPEGRSVTGNLYQLSFRTSNSMDLLSFAMPGLYIAEGTSLKIGIGPKGRLKGRLDSQRIAFREDNLKNVSCQFDNENGALKGTIGCESINVATLMLQNSSLRVFADNNHIGVGFVYDNPGEMTNRGELFAVGDISRDDAGKVSYQLGLLPSSIYLNSREWNIYPSEVEIDGSNLVVRHLEFRSGEQAITASGGLSGERPDTLDINMERFDISVLNPILDKNLAIGGAATGTVSLMSPMETKGMKIDFICDSTYFAGESVGNLNIASRWNEMYNKMEISVCNSIGGKSSFDITGSYYPSLRRIEAKAVLDRLNIHYAQPFLADVFSEMDGGISGEVEIAGGNGGLDIRSSGTMLENAGLRVAYTNVRYVADGPFRIDNSGIHFEDITIADRFGNRGTVTGQIGYEHFRDMYFDTRINVQRIEAINIDEKNADAIYGNLFATGQVSITGPMNSIMLTANASTAGAGTLHIPLSGTATAGVHNLLRFKEPEIIVETDPYEEMMKRLKQKDVMSNDFGLKLRVSANPAVEAFIEIDKASGNVITGRGNGLIELDIRPTKDIFGIKGDYTISSGNYRFVALGIATRDFSINEGSTIKFNGDIMESTLDINATYRTKTSLSTLISDTTSVSNRRVVDCGIRITDKIANPRLDFSIDIPDLDPIVKSRVESALSTEDKVQKQFLSLIISNNFLPDEQSGIVNNSSVLFSNVTEIMTNQLNNIFQKLDIPLDLGLNYQPNDTGNDIFDVAVSTQLFNNRVIVNGNIGNRQYNNGNSNSDVVGDLDIEIKLDRPGAFRLNLFSHAADQYTNYLDNSQRSGIGLTYQQEFNHIGQFFRNLFSGKKKREERERIEAQARLDEEKIRIPAKGKK